VVVIGGALAVAAWVGLGRRGPASFAAALVGALALVLTGEAIGATAVNPPYRAEAVVWIRLAAAAGFALTTSLLLYQAVAGPRRLFALQVLLLFAAGAVLRGAAVVAVPDPHIDVYKAQAQGAKHLLARENPYRAAYDDAGAPFYPPLPLLVGAAVRAVGLDVRFGNVVADLAAALALWAAAAARGDRLLGALLAAAYLHFPRVPLLTELAWYEPQLAALLGGGLFLVARGWRLGYLLLGLAVTGKQYGLVFLPPLWAAGRGRRVWLVLGTAAAAAVTVLPFLLWDPSAFLERVVWYHLHLPVRADGLTIQAAAWRLFGVLVPPWVLPALTVLAVGGLACRTPARAPGPAPWLAAALLVFCLCHTQAFINYYYLVQYLMLFGLTDWFGGGEAVS
jgi:hypothetical protein